MAEHNSLSRISDRRGFLRVAVAVIGMGMLAACRGPGGPPPSRSGPDLFVAQFCVQNANCPFAIARYDGRTGGSVGFFVSPTDNGGMIGPDAVVFGPDGHLYVSSFMTHEVIRFDGKTGESMGAFVREGSGGLRTAHGIAWDPRGNLYVTSRGTGNVLRYDGETGEFLGVFISRGAGGLTDPTHLEFRDSVVYVTDYTTDGRGPAVDNPLPAGRGGAIRLYAADSGEFVRTLVAPGPNGAPNEDGLDGPHGFVFGPDGTLYVASSLSSRILRYDPEDGRFLGTFVPPDEGGLNSPEGMAFGPDGHLYVTDFTLGNVLRFNGQDGTFIDEFVPRGRGGLTGPGGLTFHTIQ